MLMVWAGLAVVGMVWAGWRRRWFAFGLSLTTLVGLAASVIAVERIVGPIGDYLAFWMELLPVPGAVAIGVLTVDGLQHRATGSAPASDDPPTTTQWWRLGLGWVMAAVLVLPIGLVAGQLNRGSALVDSDGNLEIAQLTSFAVTHLSAASDTHVLVVIGNADRWPEASGLVLQLSRDGYHPTVAPTWGFMFTPRYVAGPTPQAQVVLTDGVPGAPAGVAGLAQTFSLGDVPTTATFVPAPAHRAG